MSTGCIQACAFAHHHKQIAGLGDAGVRIDIAADDDLPAIAHLTINTAKAVNASHGTRGYVNDRLLTDPDRTAMADGVDFIRLAVGQPREADSAAPGVERAIDRQLADAAQVNRLTRINRDHRAFTHRQGSGRSQCTRGDGGTRVQVEAGATALGQHTLEGVFLVQRRGPALQRGGRVAARWRGRSLFTLMVDRHRNINVCAVGDQQAFVTGDVVGREAFFEEITGHMQGVGVGCRGSVADLHLARLYRQSTAAGDPVCAQLTAQLKRLHGRQGCTAALAADELAVQANGGPGRHIDHTALRQFQVAGGAQ